MSFRELLKLYKEGQLDGETVREVEEAIDREDAILEYLSERDEISLPGEEEEETDAAAERDAGMEERFRTELTRRIRRAFVRLGICVGAVLLAVLLLVEFVLPRVVDRFYYDPGETVYEYKDENMTWRSQRMNLDMSVYSELFLPGIIRDNVRVIGHGYGEYDIVIMQNISWNGRFTDVGGRISKGQLILYDNNTLKRPVGNTFEWGINMYDPALRLSEQIGEPEEQPDGSMIMTAAGVAGYPDDARVRLAELEEGTPYRGFVSLDAIMDYESFYAFLQKHDLAEDDVWCAVLLSEIPGGSYNIGFDIFKRWSSLSFDQDKYPNLKYDSMVEVSFITTEAEAREHLTSLLRYMSDQKQFWDLMELNVYYNGMDRMIGYLEENGVQVYGFSVIADKDVLLALQDSPEVYSVAAEPIL